MHHSCDDAIGALAIIMDERVGSASTATDTTHMCLSSAADGHSLMSCPFDQLPNELLVGVLLWLPLEDVVTAGGVSRRWHSAASTARAALAWCDMCPFASSSPRCMVRAVQSVPSATCLVLPYATHDLLATAASSCTRLARLELGAGEMRVSELHLGALRLFHDNVVDNVVMLFPHLRAFALRAPVASHAYSGVSPEAFEVLVRGLANLRRLEVSGCVAHVAFPPPWTDQQRQQAELAAALAGEPDAPAPPPPPLELALTHITLERVWMTQADLAMLFATAPRLVELRLHSLVRGSAESVVLESANTPTSLRSVILSHLDDVRTVAVRDVSSLVVLELVGCSALHDLACDGTEVATLLVEGCFALATVSVKSLTLRELDLTNCVSLAHCGAECPALRKLSLRGCRDLRAAGLSAFAESHSLPMLAELDVTGATMLSSEGIAMLLAQRPFSHVGDVGMMDDGAAGRADNENVRDTSGVYERTEGLSKRAAAAVRRGAATAAAAAVGDGQGGGCTMLRAGGVVSRRMDIVGTSLLRIELTQMQLCHDLVVNSPRLVSLSIANPSRELELDDALESCTLLEELIVTDAVRPLRTMLPIHMCGLVGAVDVRMSGQECIFVVTTTTTN